MGDPVPGVRAAPRARLRARVAPPVRTGWDAPTPPVGPVSRLDDLIDVEAPPDAPGVLERQVGGAVRPVSRVDLFAEHVNAPAPHPAYDDLPSLTLLLENRLV